MKSKKRYVLAAICCLLAIGARSQELLNYPLDTIQGEEVYLYHVERSIGLYRIGVNFNVSQNDIIRLNPQLRERGVHYDELLYLPTGRKVEEKPAVVQAPEFPTQPVEVNEQPKEINEQPKEINEQPIEVISIKPSEVAVQDTVPVHDSTMLAQDSSAVVVLDSIVDGKRVIEYALLLPFESQQTKRSMGAIRMMEFYEGVLLALHDLQNDSTMYRLRVYDIARSDRRVRALCDSTELERVQGIIGPVYVSQIEWMANWCDVHHVPLMLPFSDNIELHRHPSVMQFNSTDRQEADSLCQWMIANDSTTHRICIDVKEADLSNSIRELRKVMDQKGLSYTRLSMHDLMNDSCEYALDSARENVIIVHSDRIQHARMLMPHLVRLQEAGYSIRLVSQYSWQKEQITIPQVYTSVFTSDMAREEYELIWNQVYTTQPTGDMPRYDLLGYDLMRSLIEWKQDETPYIGLQSIIRWQQDGQGGWQNAEVQVIER